MNAYIVVRVCIITYVRCLCVFGRSLTLVPLTIRKLFTSWKERGQRLCAVNYDVDVSTKRETVSQVAKVYDVLGLCPPVFIRARLLIQDLWKLEIGWDDALARYIAERMTE